MDVTIDKQMLIDAYNQVQRTQLAVDAAVRTAENATRALAEAQAEAAVATSALTLVLQQCEEVTSGGYNAGQNHRDVMGWPS